MKSAIGTILSLAALSKLKSMIQGSASLFEVQPKKVTEVRIFFYDYRMDREYEGVFAEDKLYTESNEIKQKIINIIKANNIELLEYVESDSLGRFVFHDVDSNIWSNEEAEMGSNQLELEILIYLNIDPSEVANKQILNRTMDQIGEHIRNSFIVITGNRSFDISEFGWGEKILMPFDSNKTNQLRTV